MFVKPSAGWSDKTQDAKLTAGDGAAGDWFGISVAIDGDTVVAGTYRTGAYIFVPSGSTWSQQQKLTGSDGGQFGNHVAISGDTVVVGSRWDDDGGDNSGSAYVFVRSASTWSQQQKITAGDPSAGEGFGLSIAFSGNTMVVGSRHDGGLDESPASGYGSGSNTGSAYVFVQSGSTWSQDTKLTAGDAAYGDEFGIAVAISGNTVIVGSNRDSDAASGSGSAYVFALDGG